MNVYLHMWRCKHFLLLKTHAQKHTQRTATQSHFLCSMAKKSKGSVRYYMCCFLLKAAILFGAIWPMMRLPLNAWWPKKASIVWTWGRGGRYQVGQYM